MLWVIRKLGLTLDSRKYGLTYRWVASSDGAFDHWFELDGEQEAIWYIRDRFGFWQLVRILMLESRVAIGDRRIAYKESVHFASEAYYCSNLIFDTRRDSFPSGKPTSVTVDIFLAEPIIYEIPLPAFKSDRYRYVYRLRIKDWGSDQPVLEEAFRILNVSHPSDYDQRSLSVGDVVTIDGDRSYICDCTNWIRLEATVSRPTSETNLEQRSNQWLSPSTR